MMNEMTRTTFKPTAIVDFHCDTALARLLPQKLLLMMRAEFSEVWESRRHMLHLAMTEAAALAGQTRFPELFLPALALEKAEALAAWNRRQQTLTNRVAARPYVT